MKRVTSKQKRAKRSVQASAHLVFTSDQHKIDREAADRLRRRASMPRAEPIRRGPFPHDGEVSCQGHFVNGKFERQPELVFTVENVEAKKQCSWYIRGDPRRPNGKGRRESTGILEVNISLPVGVALALSRIAEKAPKAVSELLEEVGLAGMKKLEELTEYIPVYMALHPDSEGTLSFHFGVSPVDPATRKLVGRSAGGKKGRRGLRLLGDAFMSILRHAQLIEIPERLVFLPQKALKEEQRNEDWEIGRAMEKKAMELLEQLRPGASRVVEELGKAAAEDWLRRISWAFVSDLEARVADMMVENDELKMTIKTLADERDTLKNKVSSLSQRIAFLEEGGPKEDPKSQGGKSEASRKSEESPGSKEDLAG